MAQGEIKGARLSSTSAMAAVRAYSEPSAPPIVVSATGVDPTSLAWACAYVASMRDAVVARIVGVVFFGIIVSPPSLSRRVPSFA